MVGKNAEWHLSKTKTLTNFAKVAKFASFIGQVKPKSIIMGQNLKKISESTGLIQQQPLQTVSRFNYIFNYHPSKAQFKVQQTVKMIPHLKGYYFEIYTFYIMNNVLKKTKFSLFEKSVHKPKTMAKETIPEIKNNYDLYNQLLKERKSIFTEVISISKNGNNKNYLEESVDLEHNSYDGKTILIINVKVNKLNYFHFKLKCKEVFPKPFFRFDSDGGAHRNYIDEIPAEEQQVTTPHFHFYNQEGINIAYKSDALKDEIQRKALEDISLCLSHFFQESNIEPAFADTVEVQVQPEQFPFQDTNKNPLANIIFP